MDKVKTLLKDLQFLNTIIELYTDPLPVAK